MSVFSTVSKVKSTRGSKMLYWTSTILAAVAFAASGAADLMREPKVAEGLVRLGYPSYLATILGMWELLGSTTIIVPGLPRLKEWAYAGMFFTLTGAAISHAIAGDPLGNILVPLALLVAVMTSWAVQPARGIGDRRNAKSQGDTSWLAVDDTAGADGTTSTLLHRS